MITENMYQKVNINPPQVKVGASLSKTYGTTIELDLDNTEIPSATFNIGGIEMLKIAKNGFYIKGVRIEQDDKESINVYNCFREWLTWATLSSDRDT